MQAVRRWLDRDPPSPFRALATLETERLILRPLHPRDAADLLALDDDPAVPQASMRHRLTSLGDAESELRGRLRDAREGRPHPWAVVERSSGRVVGTWGAWHRHPGGALTVGYGFRSDVHGRGYATESGIAACEEMLRWPGIGRLIAHVFAENDRSLRVLVKLGFDRRSGGPGRLWWAGERRMVEEWVRDRAGTL